MFWPIGVAFTTEEAWRSVKNLFIKWNISFLNIVISNGLSYFSTKPLGQFNTLACYILLIGLFISAENTTMYLADLAFLFHISSQLYVSNFFCE